jgi:hypothetical protein
MLRGGNWDEFLSASAPKIDAAKDANEDEQARPKPPPPPNPEMLPSSAVDVRERIEVFCKEYKQVQLSFSDLPAVNSQDTSNIEDEKESAHDACQSKVPEEQNGDKTESSDANESKEEHKPDEFEIKEEVDASFRGMIVARTNAESSNKNRDSFSNINAVAMHDSGRDAGDIATRDINNGGSEEGILFVVNWYVYLLLGRVKVLLALVGGGDRAGFHHFCTALINDVERQNRYWRRRAARESKDQ